MFCDFRSSRMAPSHQHGNPHHSICSVSASPEGLARALPADWHRPRRSFDASLVARLSSKTLLDREG